MSFPRDTLFDQPQSVVDFQFDERTVAVFPDMIHRSIPAYASLLTMTGVIGADFVSENGHIYDLGCSLGGVSLSLRRFIPETARITAVDLSSAMVQRFEQYIQGAGIPNIQVIEADITEMPFEKAELMILNFVLQFIPPEKRDGLLTKLYQALPTGGALLIAEKTRPIHEEITRWHEAFKRAQGYSDMAIAQKRESLENVMKTDRVETLENRLNKAGFSCCFTYFQGLSFQAWVAIK